MPTTGPVARIGREGCLTVVSRRRLRNGPYQRGMTRSLPSDRPFGWIRVSCLESGLWAWAESQDLLAREVVALAHVQRAPVLAFGLNQPCSDKSGRVRTRSTPVRQPSTTPRSFGTVSGPNHRRGRLSSVLVAGPRGRSSQEPGGGTTV